MGTIATQKPHRHTKTPSSQERHPEKAVLIFGPNISTAFPISTALLIVGILSAQPSLSARPSAIGTRISRHRCRSVCADRYNDWYGRGDRPMIYLPLQSILGRWVYCLSYTLNTINKSRGSAGHAPRLSCPVDIEGTHGFDQI